MYYPIYWLVDKTIVNFFAKIRRIIRCLCPAAYTSANCLLLPWSQKVTIDKGNFFYNQLDLLYNTYQVPCLYWQYKCSVQATYSTGAYKATCKKTCQHGRFNTHWLTHGKEKNKARSRTIIPVNNNLYYGLKLCQTFFHQNWAFSK